MWSKALPPTHQGETRAELTRPDGGFRPIMLVVETVNICNHHCIICAYDYQSRRKQHMAREVFETCVEQ